MTKVILLSAVTALVMVANWHTLVRVEARAMDCTKEEPNSKCKKSVSDLFTGEMFEGMFLHRNDRMSHAQGFWSYGSFLSAAKMFAKDGFGSVGGEEVQKRELAAFFAHVAHETSCGWPGSVDGPYAWGLCYHQELSPSTDFCKTDNLLYPCAPGATYWGRGALPLYWNYNYGPTGVALHQDLLRHPEILAWNETVAWQAAIWYWMTPTKARPSPHQVMVGNWVPSKNDTLAQRQPGFGMTINIKASDGECGHGEDTRMQDRIGHFVYFLQGYFGGVDPGLHLDCGTQGVVLLEYATLYCTGCLLAMDRRGAGFTSKLS